ncbi:MAG: HlyD family type I secretion periplasmic adaptor subunit [Steroidobacteraceae bacterium]
MNPAYLNPALDEPLAEHVREASRLSTKGLAILLFGLLPILAWISIAPLSSAVIASAFVKVDLNRRPVQHREGGIVREVRVRDGQRVAQGEPLLVLGDVAVDADLNRINYRLMAERAGVARLEAEQVLLHSIRFPDDLVAAARGDRRLAEQVEKERALFAAQRSALVGQTGLLREQRLRVDQEVEALRAQIANSSESLRLQRGELESNRNLRKEGYVSAARVAQLEAAVADYASRIEEQRSALARALQRIAEINLKINALEGQYRQAASDQLRESASRVSEFEQEHRKSADASDRQLIVAPTGGEIIGLKYMTPGAVIAPRETIAEVVPFDARLVIEARVRTEDINRVHQGQQADIRFTAFNGRITKLVSGNIVYVAGDRLVDPVTNLPYYMALIETDAASLKEAGDLKLQAGMPAEVYLKGEKRTALQYLLEPVTTAIRRAGKES